MSWVTIYYIISRIGIFTLFFRQVYIAGENSRKKKKIGKGELNVSPSCY